MAVLTRTHPAAEAINVESIGKDLQFFVVDYTVAVNGSAGPEGAQAATQRAIGDTATVVCIGPLVDSNTQQNFAVEGSDAVVVATLQTAIRALGTVDSINLGSSTVTETKLGILTAAVVT
ncbi:uncharacterized protein METZ01_LOCUS191611 [marine metagenome]|jgi:hypothetical protein|uniref:Uncharacterized protein n=1 Tax=marine metagenome TaxID=408172 RepID=A0A382DMB9_9ZZZZ